MIDNYIMDQSPRITMTLSEILANTPPVQTLAQATDVPGTNLEWMKTAAYLTGAWFGDLGELGTTGFRDSLFTGYLARGVTCNVSGVPYSWNGTGWVSTSNVAPCYDTWDLAVAAAGSTLGWTGYVKRLCGNGYFHAMHNGTRLAVSPGESIIRDAGLNDAGYGLTATSTAYVTLASYTIPAGLIATGEEWEGDVFASSPGPHGGSNSYPRMRVDGASMLGSNYITAAGRTCRCRGAFVCLSSALTVNANDIYQNGSISADVAFNSSNAIAIDIGIAAGSINDVLRIRYACLRRIG